MNWGLNQSLLRHYGVELTHEQFLANGQKKVVVGMSGGVDSSVAALLAKLQGYEVIGLFMKNWDETLPNGVCPADEDYQDVVKVCEALDIPYYSVNFVKEYWEEVFSEFLSQYEQGFTPNPDILCNREIKFKVFYERSRLLGADYLATGHYCQTRHGQLLKGVDANKDQTYFLYAIESKVLQHVLFPIGHLPKPQVRKLAQEFQLATSQKKDSTGICFIGERNFKAFLGQYIKKSQGAFVDLEGRHLGQHDGACFYTLGQRKGLGIGGPGLPWFVVGKKHETNEVILAQGTDHPALYADELLAQDLNWMSPPPAQIFRCKAKVRYRQVEQACEVTLIDGKARVHFDTPQRAMTPGQSVVFYLGEVCLGGGIIKWVSPNYYELKQDLPPVLSLEV